MDGDEVQPIVQFDKVDIFLVVYSVVDFSSVIFARACMRQLKKSCSSFSKSLPPVIILVANKMDLAQSVNSNAPEINFVVSRTGLFILCIYHILIF